MPVFNPYFAQPIYALAAGVMAGGIAQLSVQWVALVKIGLAPRFSLKVKQAWQDSTVQHIMRQMLPAILGVSVAQISLLINTNIATWLEAGSVTWLSFADRLMEFPTALLGVALGTVLLPRLSAAFANNNAQSYSAIMDWGLRITLLLGLPAALGLAMLSDGLVATLFNYGAFSKADVLQTRLAVMAYSVGLLGLLAVKILAPGFYARQDIKTPVRIAIIVLIITQCFNVLLVPLFAHAGLALSIGLGASINSLCLLIVLRKKQIYVPNAGWWVFILRLIPSLVLMAAVLWFLNSKFDWFELASTPAIRALSLGFVIIVSAIAYAIGLLIAGFRPKHFTRPAI